MTAPSDTDLEATAVDLEAQAMRIRGWKAGTPTPAPTPSPTPPPTTDGLKDRGKFKLARAEYFNVDCAEGQFLTVYRNKLTAYPSSYLDTNGQQAGTGSHYDPNNLSVSNGWLHVHCRPDSKDRATAANPELVNPDGTLLDLLYGRWEIGMYADPVSGYKVAIMLWPASWQWNDGEIDFVEGSLTSEMQAYNHIPGNPSQNDPASGFKGNVALKDHHTYAVEWSPGLVEFFVDDKSIGKSAKAPTKKMHFNGQVETNLGGTQPKASDNGFVYIDYIGAWSYAG